MCFSETWLTEDIDNSLVPGYTTIRADRDSDKAQKSVGGGLCMFVIDSWATQYCVRERVCVREFELLTVSLRPFYLPREFGQITVILIYVPGPDFKTAAERITESFNEAVSRSVDQPVFILGDFNSCDLSPHLPTLQQYITCPTRLNRTIDLCYGNIESAYRPVCRPPLGRSDHNVVHLLPKYRQKVKTEGTQTKSCQLWTHDSIEELHGCFEATNWDVFIDNCTDPDELVNTVTSYVKFC